MDSRVMDSFCCPKKEATAKLDSLTFERFVLAAKLLKIEWESQLPFTVNLLEQLTFVCRCKQCQ